MSKITQVILPQNFEFVRDRIANILQDEISQQLILTGDYDIDADVYVERLIPFKETELPAINVSIDTANWGNKNQGNVAGTYVFNIDCVYLSKSTEDKMGDEISATKAQRLAGLCRAILEDPLYKTLGFTPPFISRTFCNDMKFGTSTQHDANNVFTARVAFHVVVNETSKLTIPNLIEGYDTSVKLGSTNKGYFYQGENY